MKRFWPVINTSLAAIFGILTLIGYFFDRPVLIFVKDKLVFGAVILAAFAILVGVTNLFMVHMARITKREKGNVYSSLLMIALFITLLIGFLPDENKQIGINSSIMKMAFNAIIFPVEASLMALLSVSLLYASIRLLRTRNDWMTVVFMATAVFGLATITPLPFLGEIFFPVRNFITDFIVTAGARGILIGISLGILTTGLRVLLGADRPFGGK